MTSVPSVAFLDHLLDHVDPHVPQRSAQRMHAQHICAAWLVLLRGRLDLKLDDVAEAAGVPEVALRRLEAGLAGQPIDPANLAVRLAETLARPGIDARRIAQVAAIAAGGSAPDAVVMAGVLDDVERGSPAVVAASAPAGSRPGLVLEVALHADLKKRPALLYKNKVALQILSLLAPAESDLRALWYAIDPQRGTAKMVQVGGALEALHGWGLIENSPVPDPATRQTTHRYRITAAGRQALAVAHTYGAELPRPAAAPEPG